VKGRAFPLILAFACLFAFVAAAFFPRSARAIEHHFAGSAQVDYHLVPTQPSAKARALTFDGFTIEATMKVAVDLSDHLSANVKVCYACHGFEMDMMYFDYRIGDELNIRVGRFSPSFGAFNLRHDVGNHRLSDKPLAYDMGRMLRLREWNMGVLPSPFPDNGIELNGMHWFGETLQLDYAAYAVSGFKGDRTGFDLDFQQSRSPNLYYVDNNSRPTVGGRLALTVKLGGSSDITMGASAMVGALDPDASLIYGIYGGDLTFRIARTNIRAEYLVRRQQFDVSDPSRFKYVVPPSGGDFFAKHGAYFEIEQPLIKDLDLILRMDGMARVGNVAAASTLSRESSILRWTVGTAIGIERGLKVKLSGELWKFSDRDVRNKNIDVGVHLGLVGTY
jgi:hypothetical protein